MEMKDMFTVAGLLAALAIPAFLLAKRGTNIARRRIAAAYAVFAIAAIIQLTPWSTAASGDLHATARYYWLAGIQTSLVALAVVFFISGMYALHRGARTSPV